MIRISQVKMKMYIGMAIGFGVGLVLLIIAIVWSSLTINSYKSGEKYIGTMSQVISLKKDVILGQTITKEMLKYTDVHNNFVSGGGLMTKGSESKIVGKTAKYNIPKDIPVSSNMITETLNMGSDVRSLELNTVLLPSDLNEKDYVDIRIMYPNGEDYIVASQKEINKIVNEAMWINANEEEIMLINSAIVDSFLTEGTKLYAIKYANPETQIKLEQDDEKIKQAVRQTIYDTIGTIQYTDMDTAVDSIFDLAREYRNYVINVAKTEVNYQPNNDVIQEMTANKKVILQQAIDRLNTQLRGSLENRLKEYQAINEDDIGRVISGAQESISSQKELRQSILDKMAEENQ